ncbi:MAG: RNA polymerase sigma-70 factor [Bacteroidetes bacterium]|nr:RNA polymerase sigma-70 factor [Bacteroidota bacterium]
MTVNTTDQTGGQPLNMGHDEIFDDLYRAYFAPLCFFATNIICNDDDAKDLVEDVFLKLWQRKQRFENAAHAQAYLYRCVRNSCINLLRHGKRKTAKLDLLIAETEDFQEAYLEEMIRAEVGGELYRAIENLPSQCSKVITMSFIDGSSNEEIARALNLSVQTVKNHKVRGMHILKDTLPGSLFVLLLLHPFIK